MSDTVRHAAPGAIPSPPALTGEWTAGAVLLRGGPFVGLAVGVVVVAGAVLVPVGLWRPGIALPVVLVGLVVVWRLCRRVPVQPVPVWATALSLLAGAGAGLWAALTHAEHIIVRRDPGSYALFSQWIATRHGLPVQAQLEAFGGSSALGVPGFTLGSPAYFEVLHGGSAQVVPQFLLGAPSVFSLGWWAGGWPGLLLMPGVCVALGVYAVAGLAARLVGPRWAPLAAGSLALAFPVLFTARSTYSEPVALALVIAAAALLVDATATATGVGERALGFAGGLTLGVAGLVRVDVLTEVGLLVPVIAVLALRRNRAAGPIALGLLGGGGAAAACDLLTSTPYLKMVQGSLIPLAAATAVLALASAALVLAGHRRGWLDGRPAPLGEPPRRAAGLVQRWAGPAVTAVLLLVGVLLATRPLWQTVRALDGSSAAFVAGLQQTQGIPVDGARTYAEWSLLWVMWWLGPPLVAAAWLALAVLTGRAVGWLLRRPPEETGVVTPAWLVPLLVGFASSLLTLWRPGITPDHPWADRRLVPVLLPTFVIAATAPVAWAVRTARRRMPVTLLLGVAIVGIGLMLVPPLYASLSLATRRTEQGELGAVGALCAALQPGDVVVTVDNRGFNEWTQVVRGVCGHPAATLQDDGVALPDETLRTSVTQLADLVSHSGGRLVLLASGDDPAPDQVLTRLGLSPRRVVQLSTAEDERLLTRPPAGDTRINVTVWLAPWPG